MLDAIKIPLNELKREVRVLAPSNENVVYKLM